MFWLKKKPQSITIAPPAAGRVEVELHKSANKEATERAARVNAHLNDLLVENGITLKIYLAAGGHPPKKRGNI